METLAATYHGRGAIELGDPYKVLIATIISQRTREEDTARISAVLFARYPDPPALANADVTELFPMLTGSLYPEVKAPRLIELAQILVDKYGGSVPNDLDALLALPGVGRKTANCVLIYAFEKAALCVDTHMHRITNRLGWVATKTPDQTEKALEKVMPKDLWAGSNRLFLQHGRAICLPATPQCRRCPVRDLCAYGSNLVAKDSPNSLSA